MNSLTEVPGQQPSMGDVWVAQALAKRQRRPRALGSGFGVQGLGFRVQGLGFMVWGLTSLGVYGLRGLGFRV